MNSSHEPGTDLMVLDDYEAIVETLDILADPETMAAISEAEREIAAGDVVDLNKVIGFSWGS